MNCPQCHEPVGDDEFGSGAWVLSQRKNDPLPAGHRSIAVRCAHCGVFEVREARRTVIESVHGPITNGKDLRRLERLIPACKRDRRLPA